MPLNISAGLVMCRMFNSELEFFLVHPGGPFFKNKQLGVWTIPKGLPEINEDLLFAAQREFAEETGIIPKPPFFPVGTIQQKGGKVVHGWTFLGEWDAATGIRSNTFKLEWPPKSGKFQEFPEQDKGEWMRYDQACLHIIPTQIPLLNRAKIIHHENIWQGHM
jgi:predicted NUDIX family NTP pyrophosphohydrolase